MLTYSEVFHLNLFFVRCLQHLVVYTGLNVFTDEKNVRCDKRYSDNTVFYDTTQVFDITIQFCE